MKFDKQLSRFLAKSLLVSTVGSCFGCCVSAMEVSSKDALSKEFAMRDKLKKAIIALLSTKWQNLNDATEDLKKLYKPGSVGTIRKNILKNEIIELLKSSLMIYREYINKTSYQSTIKQLLDYIKENKDFKDFYQRCSKDQIFMCQMLNEIYFGSGDLVNKFSELGNCICNSVNALIKCGVNVTQILSIFGITDDVLPFSKIYSLIFK